MCVLRNEGGRGKAGSFFGCNVLARALNARRRSQFLRRARACPRAPHFRHPLPLPLLHTSLKSHHQNALEQPARSRMARKSFALLMVASAALALLSAAPLHARLLLGERARARARERGERALVLLCALESVERRAGCVARACSSASSAAAPGELMMPEKNAPNTQTHRDHLLLHRQRAAGRLLLRAAGACVARGGGVFLLGGAARRALRGAANTPPPPCLTHTPAHHPSTRAQKGWGACSESWMKDNDWCAKTCGRCDGGGDGGCTDDAPPNTTLPCEEQAVRLVLGACLLRVRGGVFCRVFFFACTRARALPRTPPNTQHTQHTPKNNNSASANARASG